MCITNSSTLVNSMSNSCLGLLRGVAYLVNTLLGHHARWKYGNNHKQDVDAVADESKICVFHTDINVNKL